MVPARSDWRRQLSSAALLAVLFMCPCLHAEPAATVLSKPARAPLAPPPKAEGVMDRIPTASWAMGCAAGAALAAHAVYQNLSQARRERLRGSCAGDCPDYRVDHYQESRERADVALRLSVLAAASAFWLVYNDPEEALDRLAQRKPPRRKHGFKVKVKPQRRGVWASVVAYF